MPSIDYHEATETLEGLFETAEAQFLIDSAPSDPEAAVKAAQRIFISKTQSYREALLGCCVARMMDMTTDITKPYINQGGGAYNGRTLDECVINPILHAREIPASKGPFLATFRRNVRFIPETSSGLRDQDAYQAMLVYIDLLQKAGTYDEVRVLCLILLHHFLILRNESNVTLARVARLSLDQQERLITSLLSTPSGGLLPLLLVTAAFQTLNEVYKIGWHVNWQGINVADKSNAAGGDVTIQKDGQTLIAIEVTERTIERARVVSTFNTKISRNYIKDYLFLVTTPPREDARSAASAYFAQGHDVNFLDIKTWIVHVLGTIGSDGRQVFSQKFTGILDQRSVPASLKVKWNDLVKSLIV